MILVFADACLKTEHPEKFAVYEIESPWHSVRVFDSFVAHSFLLAFVNSCRHKMSEIPRWISSQKVEIVRTMLSDDPVQAYMNRKLHACLSNRHNPDVLCQAMLLRESLGISADGSEKLYRDDDISAFEQRIPETLAWDDRDHRNNVQHVFIAVDPSGGGASAFSISSAFITSNGTIQVCAMLCRG